MRMNIKKKNYKNKIVYNNYQFYENAALTGFIKKQATEGYSLCGTMGKFLNILKFCYTKDEVPKSYAIFHKHLDKEIDEKIENMKTCNDEIISQNNLYIVFENTSSEVSEMKLETIEKKQNILLSVPIKKSIAFVSMLFVVSVISLVLKILSVEDGNLHFNLLSLGLYLALIITFLFYFTGDIHDIIAGNAIYIDGKMYFSSRTKFKDILFHIGDILKFGILLGSICISIMLLLNVKDEVIAINILRMWLIYCVIGYISRIQFQRSYISLLLIETFLITLSFL
ncbi:hypothetical protein L0P54_05115 [Anaerosalibacter bizertensis]|uniref:Uncharacterized protein n=1 Tax=Anaerosalibacter bizertensis TaxID=932217 RepID=A0A9Q4ACG5_9FIRM|nr:hypothetical protein [Anaerosalibacter bizertensis]MCB5559454.1 hypothetical protein [Anaerosalibacter bizertensis]MCG4565076.1 hypothetical protein [Anaerosalibacter bizertensis]MCG4582360.1 hypothetical protein [Anaerosalibacter bizertensis]MCG4586021.1 hypothetical protein [Anaerosalibacter bizertensis]